MNTGNFAGRLKELRQANGLTQQQLSERSGVSLGGLRDLEQGVHGPSWESVLALAEALGVDCKAFTQEPAEQQALKPGRPAKASAEAEKPATAKRPRGRPKKAK